MRFSPLYCLYNTLYWLAIFSCESFTIFGIGTSFQFPIGRVNGVNDTLIFHDSWLKWYSFATPCWFFTGIENTKSQKLTSNKVPGIEKHIVFPTRKMICSKQKYNKSTWRVLRIHFWSIFWHLRFGVKICF